MATRKGSATFFVIRENSFSINASLLKTIEQSFNINAWISTTHETSFNINADLLKNIETSFTLSSDLLKTVEQSFNISSNLLKNVETSFTVSATLSKNVEQSFNISSVLVKTIENTFTINSDLLKNVESTFTVRADLLKTVESSFNINSTLLKNREFSFNINATLLKNIETPLNIAADLQKTVEQSFSINADLLKNREFSFDISSMLYKTIETAINISSDLLKTVETSVSVNADLLKADIQTSFTIDATLEIGYITYETAVNINADLLKNVENSFSINASLLKTVESTFNISASLMKTVETSLSINACLLKTVSTEIDTTDSLIAHWKLDNDLEDSTANNYDATLLSDLSNIPLVAKYTFENVATDSSGHAMDLTASNMSYTTTSKVGSYSALFNGTNGYFQKTSFLLDTNEQWTLAAWVYVDSLAARRTIFSFGGTTSVAIETDGRVRVRLGASNVVNGRRDIFSVGTVPLNTWTHIIVKQAGYTAVNQSRQEYEAKIYINNVEQSKTSSTVAADATISTTFNIGCDTSGVDHFSGMIDDFRLYNNLLEDSERAFVYNNGFGTNLDLPLTPYSTGINGLNTSKRILARIENFRLGTSTTPADLVFDYTKPFTWSFWVKPTDVDMASSSIGVMGRSFRSATHILRNSSDATKFNMIFGVRVGATPINRTVTNLSQGQWHHIVCQYNEVTRRIYMHYNGVIDTSGGDVSTLNFDANTNFIVGGGSATLSGNATSSNLYIDDIRIYNRVLTSGEILNLYSQQLAQFAINATLQKTVETSLTLNADLLKTVEQSLTIQSDLIKNVEASFNINSTLLKNVEQSFTVRADLLKTVDNSFTVSASLASTHEFSFNINASLQKTVETSLTISSDLKKTVEQSLTISSDLVKTVEQSFNISSVLVKTTETSFTIEANIIESTEHTFNISADLQRTISSDYNLTDGLTGHWKLDNDATDSVGSNNGTWVGTERYSTGQVGQSGVFTTGNDMIRTGSNITLARSSATLAFWTKITSAMNTSGAYLFTNTNTDSFSSHIIYNYSTQFLYGETNTNCNEFYWRKADFALLSEGWHHFVIVFNNNKAFLYVDGVSYGESQGYGLTACSGGTTATELLTDLTLSTFGGKGTYASSKQREHDDIRVYSRSLSLSEVRNIYQSGLAEIKIHSTLQKTIENTLSLQSTLLKTLENAISITASISQNFETAFTINAKLLPEGWLPNFVPSATYAKKYKGTFSGSYGLSIPNKYKVQIDKSYNATVANKYKTSYLGY